MSIVRLEVTKLEVIVFILMDCFFFHLSQSKWEAIVLDSNLTHNHTII